MSGQEEYVNYQEYTNCLLMGQAIIGYLLSTECGSKKWGLESDNYVYF
jgi:hypothetical protein